MIACTFGNFETMHFEECQQNALLNGGGKILHALSDPRGVGEGEGSTWICSPHCLQYPKRKFACRLNWHSPRPGHCCLPSIECCCCSWCAFLDPPGSLPPPEPLTPPPACRCSRYCYCLD